MSEKKPELQPDVVKAAFKEAMREWLDDVFARFGKWSMAGISALALGALAYFILSMSGWHR